MDKLWPFPRCYACFVNSDCLHISGQFFFFGEYEGALISTTTRPCYFVLIIFFKLNKSPKGAYKINNAEMQTIYYFFFSKMDLDILAIYKKATKQQQIDSFPNRWSTGWWTFQQNETNSKSSVIAVNYRRVKMNTTSSLSDVFNRVQEHVWQRRDRRVDGWMLADSPWTVGILCWLYLMTTIVWGPNWMKHRKAWQLHRLILAYNCTQVAWNGYIFYQVTKNVDIFFYKLEYYL